MRLMNANCRIENFMNSSSQTSVIYRYLDLLAESSVRVQQCCDQLENQLAGTRDELTQSKRRSNEPNIFLTSAKNDLERSRQRCAELDRRLVSIQNELSQSHKRFDEINRRFVATQNELMQSRGRELPKKSPENDYSENRIPDNVGDKSGHLCRYCGSTNLMFSNVNNKPHYCYGCRRHLLSIFDR